MSIANARSAPNLFLARISHRLDSHALLPARRKAAGEQSSLWAALVHFHFRRTGPYQRDSYLLVSSYAPVYGLLTHDGHLLYIADGVNFRDYAYELNPDGSSREALVLDGQRTDNQNRIREQVNAIATFYKLH